MFSDSAESVDEDMKFDITKNLCAAIQPSKFGGDPYLQLKRTDQFGVEKWTNLTMQRVGKLGKIGQEMEQERVTLSENPRIWNIDDTMLVESHTDGSVILMVKGFAFPMQKEEWDRLMEILDEICSALGNAKIASMRQAKSVMFYRYLVSPNLHALHNSGEYGRWVSSRAEAESLAQKRVIDECWERGEIKILEEEYVLPKFETITRECLKFLIRRQIYLELRKNCMGCNQDSDRLDDHKKWCGNRWERVLEDNFWGGLMSVTEERMVYLLDSFFSRINWEHQRDEIEKCVHRVIEDTGSMSKIPIHHVGLGLKREMMTSGFLIIPEQLEFLFFQAM